MRWSKKIARLVFIFLALYGGLSLLQAAWPTLSTAPPISCPGTVYQYHINQGLNLKLLADFIRVASGPVDRLLLEIDRQAQQPPTLYVWLPQKAYPEFGVQLPDLELRYVLSKTPATQPSTPPKGQLVHLP